MIDKDKIIKEIGIHPLKVKNIYGYGSRVYGTFSEKSDYDIIIVANSMNESSEIVRGDLNIHIHTPDNFIRNLMEFDMHNLECIYAPQEAKILENVIYHDPKVFKIKPEQLKYKAMNQSYNSFHKANIKINDYEMYIGTKSLFHSMRILVFAKQILDHGRITDFSAANIYWNKIKEDILKPDVDWVYFKKKYLPMKIELEKKLKE